MTDVDPRPAPAVFLDRDGTLVRDFRHAADGAAFELLPGVPEALGALQAAGYRLVVASNQSGVARGLYTAAEARGTAMRVAALLRDRGVRLDGYYFCPHYATGRVPRFAVACACRKPAPGLLKRAAADLRLDLARSWMIGDTLDDVAAGFAAGAGSILVDVGTLGYGTIADVPEALTWNSRIAAARNLPHAAAIVLAAAGQARASVPRLGESSGPMAPLPWTVFARPPRPPDRRRTGDPHPFPDADWLARAAADARRLVGS